MEEPSQQQHQREQDQDEDQDQKQCGDAIVAAENGHIDVEGLRQESTSQSKPKATNYKYIKDEKLAILSVLLDLGMELWEMEKPLNKPWRNLYWEQRVALPVREKLKSNASYLSKRFDIDAKFGGALAVENLRKWVRSQRTQELERVEGERQRVHGSSPPARPMSEVQRLRAKVFEEITAAALGDGSGGGDEDVPQSAGESDTVAVAAAAASAAGAFSGGRSATPGPLATLCSPLSSNGGANGAPTSASLHCGTGTGSLLDGTAGAAGAGAGPGADKSLFLRQQHQPNTLNTPNAGATAGAAITSTANGVSAVRAHKPLLPKLPEAAAVGVVSTLSPVPGGSSISGSDDRALEMLHTRSAAAAAAAVAELSPAARPATELAAIAPRRRSVSETTPEDFRLGGYVEARGPASRPPPPPKKRKTDHTALVNRVLTQIASLRLPRAAYVLLANSLQAKIASSALPSVSPPSVGAQEEGSATAAAASSGTALNTERLAPRAGAQAASAGMSLEERQLVLEERQQASREAESAQALAERRLQLMEEMRAAGHRDVVTDEVLQKQRLVVLGL